ncbi:MAG: protein-L-isoaspartate(D-aspartate) O-methyltransferase [Gammaproteobacteria bacterium]|nr:protein-L-isoaspartate(D-aspartate) O-methyltransferase [Gammaproteobacteria bacterium]MYB35982.1 protein-L-isoaspartate(D-aspartate) O-methyltransferase [Gammaproteobacteria bacterium]
MNLLDIDGAGLTSQRNRDRLAERLARQGIADGRVLEAIRTTPRHLFVDSALADRAYEDIALPIGHGQTISQPWVVAAMTEAAIETDPGRVLEVGTGSGYQAAVLARLVRQVFTVERIAPLVERARRRLRDLRIRNVHVRLDDGNLGWRGRAPFDTVVVTAGAETLPEPLLEQVAVGGRLVIPVGNGDVKDLCVITRNGDGWRRRRLRKVRFVPLREGVQR